MNSKKQIAIIGSTGYTGASLVRILSAHPQVEIKYLSSNQYAGQKYSSVFPEFTGRVDLECVNADEKFFETVDVDLVFFATPNGLAKDYVPSLIAKGTHVVDLSADYRFKDLSTYETWYGFKRNDKDTNAKAIYGLVEFNRKQVKKLAESKSLSEKLPDARLARNDEAELTSVNERLRDERNNADGTLQTGSIIGNPGCYTTSSILALGPLLQYAAKNDELIDWNSIIIDGKSGISGAGRKAETQLLYTELNESCSPYNLGGKHRHIPELEEFFSDLCTRDVNVTFSPHLIPMSYGLLTTCYVSIKEKDFNEATLRKIYQDFYKDEYFVHLLDEGVYPKTLSVVGTNNAHVQVSYDAKTQKVIITCAIDNLYKGAAGQAVQNMNLVFGFEENLGL